jgi:hypothetical protein
MPDKIVPGYIEVPIAQADLRVIRLEALNAAATVFNVTVDYIIRDSLGVERGRAQLTKQIPTAPDPVFINLLLAAVNQVKGT